MHISDIEIRQEDKKYPFGKEIKLSFFSPEDMTLCVENIIKLRNLGIRKAGSRGLGR